MVQMIDIYSAIITSYVYLRSILAFFCPDRKNNRKDDIVATDFQGGWRSPSSEEDVRSLSTFVGKELAHLSYADGRIEMKSVDLLTWALGEVDANWRLFVDALDRERRAWFEPEGRVQSFRELESSIRGVRGSHYLAKID